MTERLAAPLRDLLAAGEPAVLVTVERVLGSAPRDAGAAMLVGRAVQHGTVGGGRLEWEATARARAMLESGEAEARLELPLGPAVGQCCGGHVALRFQRAAAPQLGALEAEERTAAAVSPPVLVFGAGHVGRALTQALAPLPLRVRWIDPRADAFPPPPAGVTAAVTQGLSDEVAAAEPGSAFFVLTHSHALDFEVCAAVLERQDFAYLGLIGSKTKRARFEHGLRELGLAPERMVCPIGGSLRDKRPAVIAALAAAELLVRLARQEAT